MNPQDFLIKQMSEFWPGMQLGNTGVLSEDIVARPFGHGLETTSRMFPNITRDTSPTAIFRMDQTPGAALWSQLPGQPVTGVPGYVPGGTTNFTVGEGMYRNIPFEDPNVGLRRMRALGSRAASGPNSMAAHEAARRILYSGDLDLEFAAHQLIDQMSEAGLVGQHGQEALANRIAADIELQPRFHDAIFSEAADAPKRAFRPPGNKGDQLAAGIDELLRGDLSIRQPRFGLGGPFHGKGLALLQMAKRLSPALLGAGLIGGAASLMGKNPYSDRDNQSLPAALARSAGFA
jgi:hypothetical protein